MNFEVKGFCYLLLLATAVIVGSGKQMGAVKSAVTTIRREGASVAGWLQEKKAEIPTRMRTLVSPKRNEHGQIITVLKPPKINIEAPCSTAGKQKRSSLKEKALMSERLEIQGISRNFTTGCKETMTGQQLHVSGDIVGLSDIKSQNCSGDMRSIEIFATKEVWIDVDLEEIGKVMQVTIIAPSWRVLGSRIINLSGEDGKNLKEYRAKDGSKDGDKNGEHGLAGLPGGPAGSFFGIVDTIINANNLSILANGGNGGPGQTGGHGAKGEAGITYKNDPEFNCKKKKVKGWRFLSLTENPSSAENATYKIFGTEATPSGNGGDGGVGGAGGKAGEIIIQESSGNLFANHSIRNSSVTGKTGADGAGGSPGFGQPNGKNVKLFCERHSVAYFFKKFRIYFFEIEEDTGNGGAGSHGVKGASQKMKKKPRNPLIVKNLSDAVYNYKLFAEPYLKKSDMVQRDVLSQFYNSLNTRVGTTRRRTMR